jgi:hypothetical protein
MICSHFFRSAAKLLLVVASMAVRARSLSITKAQQGEPLQPFCGALTSTSTPVACMSTHNAPLAMQSSTSRPPTSRAPHRPWRAGNRRAGAGRRRFRRAGQTPQRAVVAWMEATTSAMGAGAKAAWRPVATGRALSTSCSEAIWPMSRICDQR